MRFQSDAYETGRGGPATGSCNVFLRVLDRFLPLMPDPWLTLSTFSPNQPSRVWACALADVVTIHTTSMRSVHPLRRSNGEPSSLGTGVYNCERREPLAAIMEM